MLKTRPLAPRTAMQYSRVLIRAFGTPTPDVYDIDPSTLTDWSESERRMLRYALKDRLERLGADRDASDALIDRVPRVYTTRRHVPKPSTRDADAFERAAAKYEKKRFRYVFAILLRLGLRAEEFLTLSRKRVEVAVESGSLVFKRKGGREVELPAKHIRDQLVALLRIGRAMSRSPENDAIVLANGGPPPWEFVYQLFTSGDARTAYNIINRAVKRCAQQAGLNPSHWSPHKLRHAFATRMHSDGASIRVVQEALGHANLNTTQKYVNVERGDIEKYLR